MISTEVFYAAFERAGWLAKATWLSQQVGAQPVEASVRFSQSTARNFENVSQGLQSNFLMPAGQFPGICKGDSVVIVPKPGAAPLSYRVQDTDLINGGSQRAVTLKKA